MRQLAELVIKKTNSASSIVYREPTFKNFDEVMYRCPDASKLQRLGWAPKISLDQTIQQVVDFLRRGD
jgi:nucleoside-diphosphate-sugar epimerase